MGIATRQSLLACTLIFAAIGSVARASPSQEGWTITSTTGGVWAYSYTDREGFRLYFNCNASTHAASFTFNAEKYRGHDLAKIRDAEKPFVLDVKNVSGNHQRFPFIAYFTNADGDDAWVPKYFTNAEDAWVPKSPLTSAFLDAFGQDGVLSVQTEKGLEAASWNLRATSRIRELFKSVCGV